jgi:hypothetical protein
MLCNFVNLCVFEVNTIIAPRKVGNDELLIAHYCAAWCEAEQCMEQLPRTPEGQVAGRRPASKDHIAGTISS